jgi:hypothetical protein
VVNEARFFLGGTMPEGPRGKRRTVLKAGKAVTGANLKKLESASRQCYRSALKDKTELADMEIPNAKIECQAFTRDLGGMNISIWIDDALSVWPVLNER